VRRVENFREDFLTTQTILVADYSLILATKDEVCKCINIKSIHIVVENLLCSAPHAGAPERRGRKDVRLECWSILENCSLIFYFL